MRYDTAELKRNINMQDLAERYGVTVRHKMCCCPFHDERHPSMKIYPDGYRCFACGEHGDAISWVMKHDGLSFPQAVEKLVEMYGLAAEQQAVSYESKQRAELLNRYNAAKRRVKELEPPMGELPSEEFWVAIAERNRLADKLKM